MGLEFGATLKEWRQARRVSQLDLGLSAGVSARHISFLETGRSRPSRGMVLRLCEQLDVPIAQRNRLLMAAGLSPAYAKRDLSAEEMAPVQAAVDWTLQRHAPYPAMALDRHWRLVAVNSVAEQILAGLGVACGDSLIEMMIGSDVLHQALVNYEEILGHMVARLRVESAHFGQDDVLEDAITRMSALLTQEARAMEGMKPAIIPAIYELGGVRMSFFSTITQFGSTEDIALSELRIEMLFPADEETRLALEAMASGS
ncbi:helix-turn-helix transcriptional regulator [Shimia sp. R9_3]|uniref:helix-turn-helix domain-containing protein n=1 Tax=Shimia sp. R9_3 TaxID=2821113 RepID=UPI001AD98EAB|nr:helix-turn-helix domain-containing protein [Shimia sp. R9_3]